MLQIDWFAVACVGVLALISGFCIADNLRYKYQLRQQYRQHCWHEFRHGPVCCKCVFGDPWHANR